ncbi:ABC transporter substrate-binding protein [Microbacterium sp. KRD172]|uniref:ABC transporter substrate-binding protein n=1 Tax=Microbacterium sp. KRD172 TaxID=2729727 RepID=UPI0019D1B522|nr:ABC transporter substrate-binding protein [Microbacterium sp. KRD172]
MNTRKTRAVILAATLPLVIALAGCTGAAVGGDPSASSSGAPIRVALLTDQSGPYAEFAAQQAAGVKFAADEANANGGIDGHPVEIYQADSLGTAEGAVSAAQKLVQQNGAQFIIGTIASPTTLAVMQRLDSWGALQFGTQSQGVDLTGASCEANFFRVFTNDDQIINAMGAWLDEREPVLDWDAIGADYSFGRQSVAGLEQIVDGQGGTVEVSVFAPLGSTDFGSYISQLNGGGGLLVANSGGDSINFFKQALQFGTLEKYGLVFGNASFTTSSLNAVNDARLVGAYGSANWQNTVDTPESKAFVEAYEGANGEAPADFTGAGYMGMQALFAGVREAGSADPDAVRDALSGLTFDSIKGEVTMRAEDHQLQAPLYIAQVEEGDDGGLVFNVVDTVPADQNDHGPSPECTL